MSWQDQARALRIGQKRKVSCCSADASTFVSNSDRGISIGPCFRCGHREWEPHGPRSIAEILATRREVDRLAAIKTPTIPADTIPLIEGPPETWQWVLRGGLTPEEAGRTYGMTWHENTRRVLIPIYDKDRLIAITGRSVHGERPKYVAMGGDANTIYRLPTRADTATVVVEDILSAIAVWRAGANALAVLGTAITPVQAAEIAAGTTEVIGWFDGDKAGDAAWNKLRGRMALHPVKLTRIRTSDDPKRLHRADLRRLLAQHTGT
jgi:hypothetical protein